MLLEAYTPRQLPMAVSIWSGVTEASGDGGSSAGHGTAGENGLF
jgi:hypothetical protein